MTTLNFPSAQAEDTAHIICPATPRELSAELGKGSCAAYIRDVYIDHVNSATDQPCDEFDVRTHTGRDLAVIVTSGSPILRITGPHRVRVIVESPACTTIVVTDTARADVVVRTGCTATVATDSGASSFIDAEAGSHVITRDHQGRLNEITGLGDAA